MAKTYLNALLEAQRAVETAASLLPVPAETGDPDDPVLPWQCETFQLIEHELGALIDAASNPNRE